jgi:hypothetical protein
VAVPYAGPNLTDRDIVRRKDLSNALEVVIAEFPGPDDQRNGCTREEFP